jgi:DNA-binding IclR family transcriptional regulator
MRAVVDPDILIRVRAEFAEMPGLRLTVREASRLWQIDLAACESLLAALEEQRLVTRTRDGSFVRVTG